MEKKDANSESNRQKVNAGNLNKTFIIQQIEKLYNDGIIKAYKTEVNFNHSGYSYPKQYLVNFLITTQNDKYIIVRRTTSFRGDRSKIGLYDIEGIMKHSSLSNNIIASIYLLPDKELNKREFITARKRIINKESYSPATHLLTISEFEQFLNELKYEFERDKKEEKPSTEKVDSNKILLEKQELYNINLLSKGITNNGSITGKKGNQFVRDLVEIFSNKEILRHYKNDNIIKSDIYSLIINKILSENQIEKHQIEKIVATDTIPKLKSGGNAKTDLIILITLDNGTDLVEPVSIKNSSKDSVSCHDYKVVDFIRVLKCENSKLSNYLEGFQKYHNITDLEKNLEEGDSIEEFHNLILSKMNTLAKWALSGEFDDENLIDPEKQISKYILINKSGNIYFYTIEKYIESLYKKKTKSFGAPFNWTYPSGQDGKRIQLKVPLITIE